MKGTKSMHCVMSIGRPVRACTRLSEAAKALATRDHVKDISGPSALSNNIKFPPRSKGGACDKLYEALQAAFRLHWVKGSFRPCSSSQRQTLVTSSMNAGCRRCGVMRRHSCIYSLHLVEIESTFYRRALSVLARGSLPRPNIRDICASLQTREIEVKAPVDPMSTLVVGDASSLLRGNILSCDYALYKRTKTTVIPGLHDDRVNKEGEAHHHSRPSDNPGRLCSYASAMATT
jgi:hypothetical protein